MLEDLIAIKGKLRLYKAMRQTKTSFGLSKKATAKRRRGEGRKEEEEEGEGEEDKTKVCFHLEIMGILDS